MIALPAIDVRAGACVQLVGGRYDAERVHLDDPIAVARGWARAGFHQLHVVDLDAATGRGANHAVIEALLAEPGFEVQVGGGVRTEDDVRRWIAAGAARVVVGTRAIEDPAWLARAAARFHGRLIVAADARGRAVVTHGWDRDTGRDVAELVGSLALLPLAGVMVTAVDREGSLAGTDLGLMAELAVLTPHPLYAAGGIATVEELRALAERGVAAAVLGMALYTGALDPAALIEEFVP